MKLSILTATYNRGNLLPKLYESIVENLIEDMDVEWLIMDDGSNDSTDKIVANFSNIKNLEIKYFKQENQGKMMAINNLSEYVTGELMLECDSDDFFSKESFKKINDTYIEHKENENIYGFLFLKYNQDNQNIGQPLQDGKETTMFDLYFRENENGEKLLVFLSKIRKKYKYEVEKGEKFITEASLFYRMDEDYRIICINYPVMICEYQENGYTRNIIRVFKENPKGYFKYFEYLLSRNLKGVRLSKKLYIIKHYILFLYLTKNKINLKHIKNKQAKVLILTLYIPGKIVSFLKFRN